MEGRIDLTEGRITEKLIKLSLPIMGTSFIQMAYNMIDMIWVGKAGSNAVAAVGTAGFFPWLAMAFILISKVGAEVKVSQSIGRGDKKHTKAYIKSSIEINIILAILYTIALIVFCDPLIGFFKLGDAEVIRMSKEYLIIMALGMVFYFINPVFTGIFNGLGNSKTPFIINTIGLITNIVLDPVLILGWGGAPVLGVAGAAIATVFAQIVVAACFLVVILRSKEDYFKIKIFKKIDLDYYKILFRLGTPVAIQNGMFTIFSMFIGRIVASWGPVPIAVQKVGSQIEAISWMTAEGLAVSVGTFIGQNYGAKKYDRIGKGFKITLVLAVIVGTLASLLLIFAGEQVFSLFISESEAVAGGKDYLRILGFSQIFMCIEITTAGAFKGFGRTSIPSVIVTVLTGARVPLAYIISKPELLGINGVWWSITLTSVLKGLLMISIFLWMAKMGKLYKVEKEQNEKLKIAE